METFTPKGNVFGPILPQFILEKPVTCGAKIMYALLCNYASERDHCWPSHATLAAKLSCSVSSVKNYLAELIGVKLISVRREQYRSCVYYLLRPEALKDCGAVKADQPETACREPTVDQTRPKIGYLNNLNKQEEKTTPPLPPATEQSLSPAPKALGGGGFSLPDFEKAWEAYPKKEAPGLARSAWLQLRQNGQLPSLPDLLASIKRFALTGSWQKEQGRFIPQMSNFLRGQRWLDTLPPEEEQALQLRLRTEKMEQALQKEQEAREARRKAENARLRPLYEAFAARFGEEARQFNEGLAAMHCGTWMFLYEKYGGPMAADVPEGNSLRMGQFMEAYQRQCEARIYREAQAAKTQVRSCLDNALPRTSLLTRFMPQKEGLCAAV
ncbi:MAG: helix-turn-helix domain-containing protein [Deltaproteobacteria bacterium]|jgi:hypothetical protein|nr:helix-turn-helix domain-containing protein [Deltaproteobacteria bacterium]